MRHAAAFPGACLYGDCSGTLGYVQDPSGVDNPDNARSHLWQHVYDKLDGVSWCKVRCTMRDVRMVSSVGPST
eukprot:561512-Pyramimonas_sp.AAC.2